MVDTRADANKLAKRLGKRISERRKSLKWTQDGLAERVGVDAETISRFERGAHLPSLPTLERLAIALHIEIGDLLSKTPVSTANDVAALDAWMNGLSEDDRKFVLSIARESCNYLRQRTGVKKSR